MDLNGQLLTSKQKLTVLNEYCQANNIEFYTPNIDYRDYQNVIDGLLQAYQARLDEGKKVLFMGSSMGGFTSEYLALQTGCAAIMINPAISPSTLLTEFIGVTENFENGEPFNWTQQHCDQYKPFEQDICSSTKSIKRIILLDMGDELIDSSKTAEIYQQSAQVYTYFGGSHGFDHMPEAMPVVIETIEDYC